MVIDFQKSVADLSGYHNFILENINDHCLRIAKFEGEYRWHFHPNSDEIFIVLQGELEIDLDDRTVTVMPGQAFKVAAGTRHRTRARQVTVNLCFEQTETETTFLEDEQPGI